MPAPTGEQFTLTSGSAMAVVTELAASLRRLQIDGIDIAQPYAEHSPAPGGSGIVLMPWPNRIRDGLWQLNGSPQQLDITEPERRNAIHGLLRNSPYRVLDRTGSSITLAATIFPQHGYPFLLETTVRYELLASGLRVTHTVLNRSRSDAPFAVGAHPYLQISDVATDELTVTVSAATHFESDERLIPLRELPLDGSELDLRSGRPAGKLEINSTFGALERVDGATGWLTAPDGRTVSMLQDEPFGYLHVYTNRKYPMGGDRGLAVAFEPMTAPADAFNSAAGLRWLGPDERWEGSWGIRYSG